MAKFKPKFKIGDWVRVDGEGTNAFKVEYLTDSIIGVNSVCEPLHKVHKIDLNKYRIVEYTIHKYIEK